MNISCRDCWKTHDAMRNCYADGFGLVLSESGRAELKARQKALYASYTARGEASGYSEAWTKAKKSGAPYEALKALKSGPRDSEALAAARKFNRDSESLFLVLLGPPGVGKTLAATLAVVDFCSKWPWNEQPSGGANSEPVLFVDAATLTRLPTFDAESRKYTDRLRACRLLVLEDAGDEATEAGKALFVELLLAREKTNRRTVITANLRPEAFKLRYGDAVADRVRASGYVPNLFGEKSQRERRSA